jgi:hypothetical protein
MRRLVEKVCILAVIIVALTAGCEEAQYNPRKERLVANELRKQLQHCQKEVETQKQLVAKCRKEQADSLIKIQSDAQKLADDALKDMEEKAKLREENTNLKAQIEELKAQIKKLKEAQ